MKKSFLTKILTIALSAGLIFLTAMDEPDYEIKGFEYGASDYITKPFVKCVFLARIKNRILSPFNKKDQI